MSAPLDNNFNEYSLEEMKQLIAKYVTHINEGYSPNNVYLNFCFYLMCFKYCQLPNHKPRKAG